MKKILQKNSTRFIISILIILALTLFTLFIGVTEKNIGFKLPRRINKVLAYLIVSFSVSYSTISFQTLTNNKLLTPSVMGLDSLYMFVQTLIVFLLGSGKIQMLTGSTNYFLSVIVMVGFSLILFTVLFKRESNSIYFLLLVGMVFGTLFGGLSSFMQVILDPNEFVLVQGKMFATFNNINASLVIISLVITGLVFILNINDYGKLDVLSLGKTHAISLGIDYSKLVLKNLISISILTSVSTALVGPVSFLGLIIASLSMQIFKSYKHSIRIFGAALICNISLLMAVILVEEVFKFNTTVSVIINFIGGLYFIYLILKEAKK